MIETLREFLLDYSRAEDAARRGLIEAEIWRQFGAERTVLVLDMSGFSLLTRRHGIIHYLSMVRRMQETVRPIIHEHDGAVVKFEADNAFAVFPTAEAGVQAARAIHAASAAENARHPAEFGIHLSSGIDHGRILLIEGRDFFGDAVNIASKLGEDLAQPGEILISKTVFDLLPAAAELRGRPVEFSISGIGLEAFSIEP